MLVWSLNTVAELVYSRTQVEQWHQKLEKIALEPRTTFTKRQVVEELIDPIEKALQTRSYAEVAEGLKEWGLEISEGSLKQYVSRYRKVHKTKVATASKKRSVAEGRKQEVGKGSKQSQSDGRSQLDDLSSTTAELATSSAVDRPKKMKAADRKPKGFIDMPDEL